MASELHLQAFESELVVELRQLISLLIKQHVRVWYTKLTEDEELFSHFHDLTEHVRTALSGRAQAVDWERFFLDSVPELVLRHLEDMNLATDRTRANLPLEGAFSNLQTHNGIVDQEAYLMNVADALVVILLPENDLTSDITYAFVRELLADLVLKTVVERLSEAWFWDELILKAYSVAHNKYHEKKNRKWPILFSRTRVELFLAWLRSNLIGQHEVSTSGDKSRSLFTAIGSFFDWDLLVLGPFKRRMATQSFYDTAFPKIIAEVLRPTEWPFLKPILTSFLIPVVDLLVGDRVLGKTRDALRTNLSHASLAFMVRLARNVLFPNDESSPSRAVPTEIEQEALRIKVQDTLPKGLNIAFFRSKQINKQLLFNILDMLLGTMFPELLRRSPEQLKEKVIRIRQANMEAAGSGGISTIRTPKSSSGLFQDRDSMPGLPFTGPTRSEESWSKVEKVQDGLGALQAMRKSFESRRNQDSGIAKMTG